MASFTDFAPALGQLTTFTDYAPGELSTLAAPQALLSPNVDLTSTVEIVNTTTATDLFGGAVTVPGGYLGAKGAVEIICGGDYLNNTGSPQTIRLQLIFGSTTLYDSGLSDNLGTDANKRGWHFRSRLQAMGSPTAQQATGFFLSGDNNAPTTGTGVIHQTSVQARMMGPFVSILGSVDTTLPQGLQLKVIHSAASANLSMRLLAGHIEMITSNR